jgi:hypothetical protein
MLTPGRITRTNFGTALVMDICILEARGKIDTGSLGMRPTPPIPWLADFVAAQVGFRPIYSRGQAEFDNVVNDIRGLFPVSRAESAPNEGFVPDWFRRAWHHHSTNYWPTRKRVVQ